MSFSIQVCCNFVSFKNEFKWTANKFSVEINTFVLKWQSLKLIGTSLDEMELKHKGIG
jgi:hypothetical protein